MSNVETKALESYRHINFKNKIRTITLTAWWITCYTHHVASAVSPSYIQTEQYYALHKIFVLVSGHLIFCALLLMFVFYLRTRACTLQTVCFPLLLVLKFDLHSLNLYKQIQLE